MIVTWILLALAFAMNALTLLFCGATTAIGHERPERPVWPGLALVAAITIAQWVLVVLALLDGVDPLHP